MTADSPVQGFHAIPMGDPWSNIVRLIFMIVEAVLVGKILFGLLDRRSFMHYLPWERRIAWIGVFVVVARNLYFQIVQFNAALTWEGAPTTALILGLFWWAVRKVRVPVFIRDPEPIHELRGEQPHNRRRSDRELPAS